MIEFIKIIVGALAFALGWRVWIKVVDRVDEIAKKKLSNKSYNSLICALFVIIFGTIIYTIVR